MAYALLAMVALPFAAGVACLACGRNAATAARLIALAAGVVEAALLWELSGARAAPPTGAVVQPTILWQHTWLSSLDNAGSHAGGLQFLLGVDGPALCLLTLVVLLGIAAPLAAWRTIQRRVGEFHALMLFLQAFLVGAFTSFDLILFYVFFELTLIPALFMILGWGGAQRIAAARNFFFYTLAGSLVAFVGLVGIAVTVQRHDHGPLTFSIPELATRTRALQRTAEGLPPVEGMAAPTPAAAAALKADLYPAQVWLFLALFAGFAVKVPLVPFHTWLPNAYAEAPWVGTALMAGLLSKLGCFGFLRACLPLLPYACWNIGLPLVSALAIFGIVYGAFCAYGQRDLKRLIAYSSISHLGFVMLGLFALNREGIAGGTFQMLSHGLATAALFMLVAAIAERCGTRRLDELGGLAGKFPALTFLMVFFCLASAGLPGLNGFVGEALALFGAWKRLGWPAALAASGILLGAWYLFTVLQRCFFGSDAEPARHATDTSAAAAAPDLSAAEHMALWPLAAACLALGLYPAPILDRVAEDTAGVAALYDDPERLQPPGGPLAHPLPRGPRENQR